MSWQRRSARRSALVAAPLALIGVLAPGRSSAAPRDPLRDPRKAFTAADPGLVTLRTHGEYQARGKVLRDLPLRPPPGATEPANLGQDHRVEHWLRVDARLAVGLSTTSQLALIGQADFPRGFFIGQETRLVDAAEAPFDRRLPLRVDGRWLFLEWTTDRARIRLGQQPVHWGLGVWTHDGNHRPAWSDYRGGARSERASLLAHLGNAVPVDLELATGVVLQDARADLVDDDTLASEVASTVTVGQGDRRVGLLALARHEQQAGGGDPFDPAGRRRSRQFVGSIHGRWAQSLAGVDGRYFLEAEGVIRRGHDDRPRSVGSEQVRLEQLGAVVQVGFQLEHPDGVPWMRWMTEWGWASGDDDPLDDVDRHYHFDPNHRVGLVLFEEVLAWQSARSSTLARDRLATAGPVPEGRGIATNGAVAGATYLQPTILFRPWRMLDVSLGMVIAQTTADRVDAAELVTSGRRIAPDGGAPSRRDLGVEFDAGVGSRLPLDDRTTLELGLQAGVLLPGAALANGAGRRLDEPYLVALRLGLEF